MSKALIGYTGFVGSALARESDFTDFFNSSNIETIRGRSFDEIVCAGVPAVKWLANKEPDADWASIDRLLSPLLTCKANRFTLVSTIDIYPAPSEGADERSPIDGSVNHPYGRHRLMVEETVRDAFGQCMIVRLPALFGDGLKKNIIFDLLGQNETHKINPASSFQWYGLNRLGEDMHKARRHGLTLINLFPEPIRTSEIAERFFPNVELGELVEPAPRYNTKTRHSELFGGPQGYIASAKDVLLDLADFLLRTRVRGGAQ